MLPEIDRERCHPRRQGAMYEFARRAWPVIDTRPLTETRYMRVVCDALQRVGVSRLTGHPPAKDLLVNIPPAHTKSRLCSVLYPAWMWTWRPTHRLICLSYSEDNVLRDARAMRDLVESNWYQSRWSVPLVRGTSAAKYFANELGGFRKSVTLRGQITGEHGDDIILDDPQNPSRLSLDDLDEAAAEAADARRIWDTVLPSRRVDPRTSRRIVIMQRLGETDLTEHILDSGAPLRHLCLPLHYDPDHPYVSSDDWRTEPRELLSPERYSEAEIEGILPASEAARAAQYEQLPAAPGAALFRWEDFRRHRSDWTDLPRDGLLIGSIDGATSGRAKSKAARAEAERSRWGITWWLRCDGRYYLLDCQAVREDFDLVMGMIESAAQDIVARARERRRRGTPTQWTPHTIVVERASTGEAAHSILGHADLAGFNLELWRPASSKVERAAAVLPIVRGGRVSLPDTIDGERLGAPWSVLADELQKFPRARSDDLVDSLSQAILWSEAELGDDGGLAPDDLSSLARALFR